MRKPALLIIFLLLALGACKSLQNEGGTDWADVRFTISRSKTESVSYSSSGDTVEAACILAVKASDTSATYRNYINEPFDGQLQDLTNGQVQLRVPLNTTIRLVKVTFSSPYTVSRIFSERPIADNVGISDTFWITGEETEKTINIRLGSLGIWGSAELGRDYWGYMN